MSNLKRMRPRLLHSNPLKEGERLQLLLQLLPPRPVIQQQQQLLLQQQQLRLLLLLLLLTQSQVTLSQPLLSGLKDQDLSPIKAWDHPKVNNS